ncbi:MAG: type II toxin-antitoxin system ParD family antitoxin [Thermomicrobiales bacterium]|nr:type II toxin-antitoxin system ParD family antitoxin [Thermomicrobiales bacterium]
MSVVLTPQLEALIHQKVQSGRYSSASEVVQEALQLLEEREAFQRLAAAINVGIQEIERGEEIPWTPTLIAELGREADEEDRLGLPLEYETYP